MSGNGSQPEGGGARKPAVEDRLAGLRLQMPCNEEAEEGMVAALLFDVRSVWEQLGTKLAPHHFYIPRCRALYEACIDMHVCGEHVDLPRLADWLRKHGRIEEVGGPGGLAEMMDLKMAGMIQGQRLALFEMLDEAHGRRTMLAEGMAMVESAVDYRKPWREGLEQAEGALFGLHQQVSHEGMVHVSKILPKVLTELHRVMNSKGHVTNGLATGMTPLDRITMGIAPGMFVIAARPSKGKTALLMQIALNLVQGLGDYHEFDQPPVPVGIWSLETSDTQLVKRGMLNMAKVCLQRIRDGLMDRGEEAALTEAARNLERAPMYIEASFGLSIQELRTRARVMVRRHKLKAIFIDYLQLLTSNTKAAQNNTQTKIAEVSIGLKHLSHELQIPIFVLAQLNRDGDVARPKMSDIRDCGQIEQDADYVGIICDAPEWASANDPEDCPWTYMGLDIVKQKDGPTTPGGDPLVLKFNKEFFRLASLEERLLSNDAEQRQGRANAPGDREQKRYDAPKRPRGRPRKDWSQGGMDEVFPDR